MSKMQIDSDKEETNISTFPVNDTMTWLEFREHIRGMMRRGLSDEQLTNEYWIAAADLIKEICEWHDNDRPKFENVPANNLNLDDLRNIPSLKFDVKGHKVTPDEFNDLISGTFPQLNTNY